MESPYSLEELERALNNILGTNVVYALNQKNVPIIDQIRLAAETCFTQAITPGHDPSVIRSMLLYMDKNVHLKYSGIQPVNKPVNKFELTDETFTTQFGCVLYRIKALQNFHDVKIGDLGGFLEKEDNLSQTGQCWVYDNAKVYNYAKISGNATVSGYAKVYDNAKVSGSAQIFGNARISGNAIITDNAAVYGQAVVSGEARIFNSASVHNRAWVHDNAEIFGNALVYGDAHVRQNARISDTAHVAGGANIFGDSWVCGCSQIAGKSSITSYSSNSEKQ